MLIGETIVAKSGGNRSYFTPWFARQGDAATSTIEVIALSRSTQVLVEVYEKNSETTGDGAVNSTGSKVAKPTGTFSFRNTALKELVRYRITLQDESGPPPSLPPNPDIYCHFRMLAPQWEYTGVQSI